MSQKTYNNVAELIEDLLHADRDGTTHDAYINIDNFSGAFYKGVEDQTDNFWKELLAYLNENNPTLQSDFNDYPEKAQSVFSYINDKSDLNSTAIWNVITNAMRTIGIDLTTDSGLPAGTTAYFWNESLSKLAAVFMSSFDDELSTIPLSPDASISISDIKNADAGYSFVRDWVKPTISADNETYEEVRGSDAIKSVLRNDSQLQFTRNQGLNNWIRLLMPKYKRKVEVEDLNRNFWVIGQTLAAISSFLFGQNSIKDLFNGILKELVGLWENTLYLWAAAAMISQKEKITDFHIEFVPMPNSKDLSYRKFDNFGETYNNTSNVIKERMNYLIKTYTESNIILIPEVRANNYKHNYYSRAEYPCMIVYNRNTGKLTYGQFQVDSEWQVDETHLVIDLKNDFNKSSDYLYVNRIVAINYVQRVSTITGTSPYYAAVRPIVPTFTATYDAANDAIVIEDFQFKFYDAAAQAINGNQYLITSFTQFTPDPSQQGHGADNTWTFTNQDVKVLHLYNNTYGENSGSLATQTDVNIVRGYYLGELISCQSILGLDSWTVEAESYWGQQLYSANPEQIVQLMEAGE